MSHPGIPKVLHFKRTATIKWEQKCVLFPTSLHDTLCSSAGKAGTVGQTKRNPDRFAVLPLAIGFFIMQGNSGEVEFSSCSKRKDSGLFLEWVLKQGSHTSTLKSSLLAVQLRLAQAYPCPEERGGGGDHPPFQPALRSAGTSQSGMRAAIAIPFQALLGELTSL